MESRIKQQPKVGDSVTFKGEKYKAVSDQLGIKYGSCSGCVFYTHLQRVRCADVLPFGCEGVIFIRPVDFVTYKLTGQLPKDR